MSGTMREFTTISRRARWRRSRPTSIRRGCRTTVRRKLGWLLLDHLRVCSIGARLPWSGWARDYVDVVGKAGASHVLFSAERSIRSTRPSSTSPSVRASMPTTPTSARCCIPASPPGRRRSRPPSTSAPPGREVVAGGRRRLRDHHPHRASRCSRATSSAASRAPAPATCSARRRPPAGCCSAAHEAERRILAAIGLAGSYSSGVAQFYYSGASGKRIQAAHAAQCGVAAALLTRQRLRRPGRHDRRHRRLRARLCGRIRTRRSSRTGSASTSMLMDVLVKSHAAAARVAAGIDAMLALRQRARFLRSTILPSMQLGIPRVIQGRLTNPHPVDLQAAQMCLPFSVALASTIPLAAGRSPDARSRRLRSGARRPPPVRARGAHHDRARRRGRGGEQCALDRRQGQRAPARRPRALEIRAGAEGQRRRSRSPAHEHEARFVQELSGRVPDKVCTEIIAMSRDLDRLDPRWLGQALSTPRS